MKKSEVNRETVQTRINGEIYKKRNEVGHLVARI